MRPPVRRNVLNQKKFAYARRNRMAPIRRFRRQMFVLETCHSKKKLAKAKAKRMKLRFGTKYRVQKSKKGKYCIYLSRR